MQEHIAKKLRISILLWLLLLALLFPYLIYYYEQQYVWQWQDMVQPHWEEEVTPSATTVPGGAAADIPEWKNIEAESLPEQAVEINNVDRVASQENPVQESPVQENPRQVKSKPKTAAANKKARLTLKLPENLYRGQTAEWEQKKPLVIPDFFAPKKEEPSRFQLGGRLIIDEDKKKQMPDASYIDTVKGAEVNIQIKTP
jgi:hypothetical protein